MESIKYAFYVGYGPSSSHTIGPYNACKFILNKYQDIKDIKVTLFGSLASTGKGHLTDYIIAKAFQNVNHSISFNRRLMFRHPNTMIFEVSLNDGSKHKEKIISVGGGLIKTQDKNHEIKKELYPHRTLSEILAYCDKFGYSLYEYVLYHEGEGILPYFDNIYQTIKESYERGIETEGYLPGNLKVKRKAKEMYQNMFKEHKENDWQTNVPIASFAVSEENAAGGLVVVAPTCGSAGVIPGVIKYLEMTATPYEKIREGFLVAGLIGMLAKTNASVSGAEAGCQAEIGVATAMGAALISAAKGLDNYRIAQAAEIALEHSLGLTCDPVEGYVQIPCIERCAIFALKAVNSYTIVTLLPQNANFVTFDDTLLTMYLTGKDLHDGYRETAKKGLAKVLKNKNK